MFGKQMQQYARQYNGARSRALDVMVGGQAMVGQCAAPANYYPPGCSPVQRTFDQAGYNAMCQAREAEARNAQLSILRANQPQIGIGINNRQNSAAGTIVAGGETRVLTATSAVPVCLTKLVVSRGSTTFFGIASLRNALQEFLADNAMLPADMFAPDSLVSPIQLPLLMPGTQLTLSVTNLTSEPHDFYAGFQGIPDRQFTGPCL